MISRLVIMFSHIHSLNTKITSVTCSLLWRRVFNPKKICRQFHIDALEALRDEVNAALKVQPSTPFGPALPPTDNELDQSPMGNEVIETCISRERYRLSNFCHSSSQRRIKYQQHRRQLWETTSK